MKRAIAYMRMLGSYLLLMAVAGSALLILSTMGILSVKAVPIGCLSGVVEVLIMTIIGAWCFSGSKASWYAAIYYFLISFVYHAVSTEIFFGLWTSTGMLQVAMLALYSGVITRVLSNRIMLTELGLVKGVGFIHYLSRSLILVGIFILISYLFHPLIAAICVLILTPVLAKRGDAAT